MSVSVSVSVSDPERDPERERERNRRPTQADAVLMHYFEHERLDVYRAAIDWLVVADEIASNLPRGRAYLADQLRRAATSVPLNIAEGAGEFSPGDKARFYRMARRSATECAAILGVCRAMKVADPELVSNGRGLLLRLVAMLTAIILRVSASDPGSGSDLHSDPSPSPSPSPGL